MEKRRGGGTPLSWSNIANPPVGLRSSMTIMMDVSRHTSRKIVSAYVRWVCSLFSCLFLVCHLVFYFRSSCNIVSLSIFYFRSSYNIN